MDRFQHIINVLNTCAERGCWLPVAQCNSFLNLRYSHRQIIIAFLTGRLNINQQICPDNNDDQKICQLSHISPRPQRGLNYIQPADVHRLASVPNLAPPVKDYLTHNYNAMQFWKDVKPNLLQNPGQLPVWLNAHRPYVPVTTIPPGTVFVHGSILPWTKLRPDSFLTESLTLACAFAQPFMALVETIAPLRMFDMTTAPDVFEAKAAFRQLVKSKFMGETSLTQEQMIGGGQSGDGTMMTLTDVAQFYGLDGYISVSMADQTGSLETTAIQSAPGTGNSNPEFVVRNAQHIKIIAWFYAKPFCTNPQTMERIIEGLQQWRQTLRLTKSEHAKIDQLVARFRKQLAFALHCQYNLRSSYKLTEAERKEQKFASQRWFATSNANKGNDNIKSPQVVPRSQWVQSVTQLSFQQLLSYASGPKDSMFYQTSGAILRAKLSTDRVTTWQIFRLIYFVGTSFMHRFAYDTHNTFPDTMSKNWCSNIDGLIEESLALFGRLDNNLLRQLFENENTLQAVLSPENILRLPDLLRIIQWTDRRVWESVLERLSTGGNDMKHVFVTYWKARNPHALNKGFWLAVWAKVESIRSWVEEIIPYNTKDYVVNDNMEVTLLNSVFGVVDMGYWIYDYPFKCQGGVVCHPNRLRLQQNAVFLQNMTGTELLSILVFCMGVDIGISLNCKYIFMESEMAKHDFLIKIARVVEPLPAFVNADQAILQRARDAFVQFNWGHVSVLPNMTKKFMNWIDKGIQQQQQV